MLPLAQVEFVLKHLIAKFFGDGRLGFHGQLLAVEQEMLVITLVVVESGQTDVALGDALLLECLEKKQTVSQRE